MSSPSAQLHYELSLSAPPRNPSPPRLIHLNADTSWLLQLPNLASLTESHTRRYFNILIDPWLSGSQVDIASWFSEQWHSTAPFAPSIAAVSALALESEPTDSRYNQDEDTCVIDAVFIAHEFTDHCHQETLLQLPPSVPIFAVPKATSIIQSWKHFTTITPIPTFSSPSPSPNWLDLPSTNLPSWLRVARIASESYMDITQLHSALMIVFSNSDREEPETQGQAIIYTPHGLPPSDLPASLLSPSPNFKTLALLHGLHRISISHPLATAIIGPQLIINLGAENGYQLAKALGAKYWIGTHDEVKKGEGVVGKVLERRVWGANEVMSSVEEGEEEAVAKWVDVKNGECLILE